MKHFFFVQTAYTVFRNYTIAAIGSFSLIRQHLYEPDGIFFTVKKEQMRSCLALRSDASLYQKLIDID